jgi:Regulator of chromosome condensation (RCC1) repeat
MANPSNEPDVKPAATFPAPNTFADVLHMQLAEELAAVHSAHQLWIQHLGYSVDESSSDEEKQEHRNKHLYLGLEKRRLEQLAHRRFGTTAYELMACGEHEYLVHGLHNERWRFTSDFQDAVRPTVNDYKSTKSVRAITAGSMHSVMLNVYGTPYSWGVAEDGALGRRVDDDSAMDGQPSRVSGFSSFEGINEDDTMCQIAAGETFTLYLSLRGNVYASGYARDIDRNKFSFSRNNELVVQVEMPGKVCFLEAGFNAGLAVLMDGSVVTFGE